MVSNEIHIVLVTEFKFMVVQSCFVSNLVRHKLSVVSSWDTLIDMLGLIEVDNEVGVHELSHLDVVGENIDGQVQTFSNSYEFFILIVGFSAITFSCIGTSIERCKGSDPSCQAFVCLDISDSDSNLLSVVETSEVKCMIGRLIKLKLMEQESIIMIWLKKIEFGVFIAIGAHFMKN